MRKAFSLEQAEFSDSSEDDIHFPSPELLQLYNKQYSFLLQETNKFFSYKCKESIHKFISLNQFGAGFNIPFLYTSLLQIEEKTVGLPDTQKQLLQQKKQGKKRYQGTFHAILKRMGKIIQDLIDFEVNFKRDYLGQNIKKPQKIKTRIARMKHVAYQQSLNVSPVNSVKQGTASDDYDFQTQENQIRTILKQKMCPELLKVPKLCSSTYNSQTNINKLLQKVDAMRKNMKECKNKEEKILQIFDRKKFSQYESSETSFTSQPQNQRKQSTQQYLQYQRITQNPIFQKMKKKHLEISDYDHN